MLDCVSPPSTKLPLENKNILFFVDMMYKSEENVRGGGQTWFTAELGPNILCKFYIKSKFNGLQNYKLLSPRNYLKFIMVNKKVLLDDSLLLASRNWKVWNIDILLVISTWQIKLRNFTTMKLVLWYWWYQGWYKMGKIRDPHHRFEMKEVREIIPLKFLGRDAVVTFWSNYFVLFRVDIKKCCYILIQLFVFFSRLTFRNSDALLYFTGLVRWINHQKWHFYPHSCIVQCLIWSYPTIQKFDHIPLATIELPLDTLYHILPLCLRDVGHPG